MSEEDKTFLSKLGISGQQLADKAIAAAVSQLISTMKYASQKIAEAEEDLPDNTILRVSASAVLVELALEVPVKELVNGQNRTRGSDEMVREEILAPTNADDTSSGES